MILPLSIAEYPWICQSSFVSTIGSRQDVFETISFSGFLFEQTRMAFCNEADSLKEFPVFICKSRVQFILDPVDNQNEYQNRKVKNSTGTLPISQRSFLVGSLWRTFFKLLINRLTVLQITSRLASTPKSWSYRPPSKVLGEPMKNSWLNFLI